MLDFAKPLILFFALALCCVVEAKASSCYGPTNLISEVITDKTLVFRGKPIYFPKKEKPGKSPGWSTVFKIDKLYNGDIGNYGDYAKIYHRRHEYELLFQIGDSYFLVAEIGESGSFIETYLGYCGAGYGEDDILEYIEMGNPENYINRNCLWDLKIALAWGGKYRDRFLGRNCAQYAPEFKRQYPNIINP